MVNEYKIVGKRIKFVDGYERVSGKAKYTADILPQGMLYAKFLGSPYAHAKITSIDTSKAEALPGVKAVITHKDTPPVIITSYGTARALDDTMRTAQDLVAAVAATSPQIAEDALKLIDVTYETLPVFLDPREALEPGAPIINPNATYEGNESAEPNVYDRGDIVAGFQEADITVEDDLHFNKVRNTCPQLETVLADWSKNSSGDKLTVWLGVQSLFSPVGTLSTFTGLPTTQIRGIATYVAGAFGMSHPLQAFTCAVALLAKKAGKPVLGELSRYMAEHLVTTRPEIFAHLKYGAKDDGTLTAMHLVENLANCGALGGHPPGGFTWRPHGEHYKSPDAKALSRTVHTNTNPGGYMRNVGNTAASFFTELMMDEVADELEMDPVEFHKMNALDKAFNDEYECANYDILPDMTDCITKGAERIGWTEKWHKPNTRTLTDGRMHGIGIAMTYGTTSDGKPSDSQVVVRFKENGQFQIMSGVTDIGGGQRTMEAMVVAEELGVPLEDVGIYSADTECCPSCSGTYGSRVAKTGGTACMKAARALRAQLFKDIAVLLEVSPEDLDAEDGFVYVKAEPANGMSYKAFATKNWGWGGPVRNYTAGGNKTFDGEQPLRLFRASFGAGFAEVAVDTETGMVEVLRYVGVHDTGQALNLLTVEGQFDGSFIQGIDCGLWEDVIYDKETGVCLSANLLDYRTSTTLDVNHEYIIPQNPGPHLPYGAYGIGEPPTTPPLPAIINAVYNAIGVRIRSNPVTPDKILKALGKA